MSDDESYAAVVKGKLSRIEALDKGNWLGNTVRRIFRY